MLNRVLSVLLFIYFIRSINSVCISVPISQFIFPHPPWYPYICSLCLRLYFCLQIILSIPFFLKPHGSASVKEPSFQCRRCKRCGFDPQVRKIPWRRKHQLIPVFLPGESHGQRSLVDFIVSTGLQRVGHNWSDWAKNGTYYFLDSTYMHILIYNICFSLSDLLHSVWQFLGPFMSLPMAWFCSF